MAVLRLFAAAREAAGTASAEVPGTTVDDVLRAARLRFGPELGSVIDISSVWCNGEPATGTCPVGPGDEVAVLPPVSGGAEPVDGPPSSRRRPTFAPSEPPPTPVRRSNRSPGAEVTGVADGDRRHPAQPPDGRSDAARRRARRPAPSGASRPGSAPRDDRRAPPVERDDPGRRPVEGAPAGLDRPRGGTLSRTRSITGAPIESTDDVAPGPATIVTDEQSVLRRMRSVRVPVTGHVTVRGKQRKVAGTREKRSAFARRYAVVYDTNGPKVTLGVLWFVAGVGSMALGWWAVTLVFAVVAGWAAADCAERWEELGVTVEPWVAGVGAAVVAASASMGTAYLGGGIVCLVLVAITRMAFAPVGRDETLAAAGTTVACALPFALAGGSVILTYDLEIGAAVVLLIFVAAYEAGDFLIGSGASNSIEGPLTGIVTIGVVSMGVAVLSVPPFSGVSTFTFAALAAVLCPVGQLAASAVLPAADAQAPAVRRIDSLLVLAPVWVWTVGLFIDSRGL